MTCRFEEAYFSVFTFLLSVAVFTLDWSEKGVCEARDQRSLFYEGKTQDSQVTNI